MELKINKISLIRVIHKFLQEPIMRRRLGSCGKNVRIGVNPNINWENVFIGDDCSIGSNALFMTTMAKIIIKNNVIFGPNVSVITGNHRLDIVGRYLSTVQSCEKRPEDDEDVVFEGDNWIGAGVIILKGVVIGFGAIVGAGSVVTKNVPPFSISAGNPCKVLKMRFTKDQIVEHIKILNLPYENIK